MCSKVSTDALRNWGMKPALPFFSPTLKLFFFFPFFNGLCILTSLYQHSQAVECFSCTFPMQVEHDSSLQTRVYSLWYQEVTNSTPSDTHRVKTCARSSPNVLVRCSQVHPTTALQQVPSSGWEVFYTFILWYRFMNGVTY